MHGSENQIPERKYDVKIPENFSWTNEMAWRMNKAISSHGLRYVIRSSGEIPLKYSFINSMQWTNLPIPNLCLSELDVNEARRRHRMRMFPAMIFGMAVLGVVIIPIGFHIMTVIGGTALLFGKMALLLAIMNSTKRVNWFKSFIRWLDRS